MVTVSSCWGCYMNTPIKNGKGPPGGADRLADGRSFPVPGTTCPGWKKWYVFYWFCCFICYLREVYREFWHHWCQIIHFLLQWSFFWISGGFIRVINNVLSCLRESTRGRGFIANFLLVMHLFTNLNILDDVVSGRTKLASLLLASDNDRTVLKIVLKSISSSSSGSTINSSRLVTHVCGLETDQSLPNSQVWYLRVGVFAFSHYSMSEVAQGLFWVRAGK